MWLQKLKRAPATTETKEDENDKLSESKIDEPVAESATNKENSCPVDEATRTNGSDDNEVVGGKEIEKEDKEDNCQENIAPATDAAPLSSFQQLSSSQNTFTGLVGTGFSSSSFSFGSISKDSPAIGFGSGSGSLSGLKNDKPSSYPSLSFANSNNGSPSLVSTTGASSVTLRAKEAVSHPCKRCQLRREENEKVAFNADAVMFEYLDGGWKERGKGELKVNVSTTGPERARLVMRTRGNHRLILNASLYPDMKLTNMDERHHFCLHE